MKGEFQHNDFFFLLPHAILSVAPSSNSGLHRARDVRTFSPKRYFLKKKIKSELLVKL